MKCKSEVETLTTRATHIDTFIVDVPKIRPHVLAMATMRSQAVVLVRITCSDGVVGIGEGTTIGSLSYGDASRRQALLPDMSEGELS